MHRVAYKISAHHVHQSPNTTYEVGYLHPQSNLAH